MNLCVTKLLPHSNMNTFLWLKVEVVGVVQALIERLLKIDKIWHPHWGRGKKKIRKINARRWGDTRNVKGHFHYFAFVFGLTPRQTREMTFKLVRFSQ